jgi:hypothetical protein
VQYVLDAVDCTYCSLSDGGLLLNYFLTLQTGWEIRKATKTLRYAISHPTSLLFTLEPLFFALAALQGTILRHLTSTSFTLFLY